MIDNILMVEKGYVNHPADRGGPTKFGITQRTLSEWRGYWVSEEEVKQLEEEEARDIYYLKYFVAPKLHLLPKQMQPFLFDSSINHGPSRAIIFLQKAINKEKIAYLVEDGINGNRTREAALKAWYRIEEDIIDAMVEERKNFYCAIVDNDPTQEVFLDGWLNRAEKFYT